jgi:hypothetical protein
MLLISKFNKLIRNKLLWAVFAVLISVSFVLVGYASRGCDRQDRTAGMEGTLFGEDISPLQFSRARYFEQGMRPAPDMDDEAAAALRKRTWLRLAALYKAREFGISVSDEQVARAIQRDPTFAENGVFNRRRYELILQQQLGIPVGVFEAYVRQDVTLRQLSAVIDATAWTPPSEVQQRLENLTDMFTVAYVAVTNAGLVSGIEANELDAREYFEENSELFRIPDQMRVRYAAYPISNFLDHADAQVSELEVQEDYTNRIDEYSTTDTNGNTTVTPLDEVSEEIARSLKWNRALDLARDHANAFALDLARDEYGNALSFAEAVKSHEVAARTTEYFSASTVLTNLGTDLDFNQTAFSLDPDDEEAYFSGAVDGEQAVYVLAALDERESRIPLLEDILDEVLPLAQEQAEREAYADYAGMVRNAIETSLTKGGSMGEAVAGYGFNVSTTVPFSVYGGAPEEDPQAGTLARAVVNLMPGDVTDPVEIPEGALVGCVLRREPGDIASAAAIRPQLHSTLDNYRAGTLFQNWAEGLLKEGNFVDFGLRAEEEEAGTEDAGGSES